MSQGDLRQNREEDLIRAALRQETPSSSITQPASAPLPRQIGSYRIIRRIGAGGMGVVYEAEQVSLGRRVALKVLPPQAQVNPRYLGRFEREARAADSAPAFAICARSAATCCALTYS